jgi:DNA-binding MarR family transcriptional regulator
MSEYNIPPIDKQTAKEAWTKLFLISDILRNTSCSVIELEYVNFARLPVIQFFLECPDATPVMKELIGVSGLSSGALSQAVNALVENGYLERVSSKTDSRLRMVRATEKLKTLREKPVRYFGKMQDDFRRVCGVTPEEMRKVKSMFVRLAESRTGGELAAMKLPSDLEKPGFVSVPLRKLGRLPVWMLLLHFTTKLKMPILMYYYGNSERISLGKLRILNYLFFLSERKKTSPTIADLAARFRCKTGLVFQTVRALNRDDMVEQVVFPVIHEGLVKLTRKGLSVRRMSSESYTRFMMNFFRGIEPEKIALFMRFLDLMLDYLKTDGKAFLGPGENFDIFE